jgi:hypothetical protein
MSARQFSKDTGLDLIDDDYAKIMKPYLGRELPRLDDIRDEPKSEKPRRSRARDAEDRATEFEADCRRFEIRAAKT